jgi:hypothetical protein
MCVCADREEISGGRSGLSRPRTTPPLRTEIDASTADAPSHTTALHSRDPALEPRPSHRREPREPGSLHAGGRSRSLWPVRHGRGQISSWSSCFARKSLLLLIGESRIERHLQTSPGATTVYRSASSLSSTGSTAVK